MKKPKMKQWNQVILAKILLKLKNMKNLIFFIEKCLNRVKFSDFFIHRASKKARYPPATPPTAALS